MIVIENLNTIVFFSFKIDQHSKTARFFFFESDKNFNICYEYFEWKMKNGKLKTKKSKKKIFHSLKNSKKI
jgi:hypothetical protein